MILGIDRLNLHHRPAVIIALTCMLLACGGGSIDKTGSLTDARAKYLGLLTVSHGNSQLDSLTRVDAHFLKLAESIPVSSVKEAFVAQTEKCELLSFLNSTSRGSTRPGETFGGVTPEPVSAGDTLLIESNSAQYAVLHREPDRSYTQVHDVSGEIPGDLSVDIPGDEFPTLTGVTFPDTPPLVVSSPLNIQQASIERPLQWNGTGSTDAIVDIAILVRDEQTLEQNVVYCLAKDDGQFTLPAWIQTELGVGSEIQFLLMARYSFVFSFFNTDTLMLTEIVPAPYVIGTGDYQLGSSIENELRTFTHGVASRF